MSLDLPLCSSSESEGSKIKLFQDQKVSLQQSHKTTGTLAGWRRGLRNSKLLGGESSTKFFGQPLVARLCIQHFQVQNVCGDDRSVIARLKQQISNASCCMACIGVYCTSASMADNLNLL